ncbi:hypothetical protein MTES_1872 [Microbacterium testaceum StLB037]|uniref:Uncharacterized protein n=1 Tax=Microbacterium testaceum (strain StLB037) TaxID=979556 RepID=E8NC03_MICTS|nr:hypothetical protein [Microbacterium testaceum]BAJ74836.1 hypothetical protein MTES_1872 [Microbacterium testaceum StLB037]
MLVIPVLVVLSLALAVIVVAALALVRRPALVIPGRVDARRPRRRRATWRPIGTVSS